VLCRLSDFLIESLLRWRHRRFDSGKIASVQIAIPVISVGSITIGGSGKTPAVLAILSLLEQANIAAAVLSRGYRRKTKGPQLIPHAGLAHDLAADYGDEPMLFRRYFPDIPVAVAAKRAEGAHLLKALQPRLILLDDGFQHRFLHRDLDILVFKKEFQGASACYFPCGELRDGLFRLKAASLILLEKGAPSTVKDFLSAFAPLIEYEMIPNLPEKDLLKEPIAAFCGVANPKRFFQTVAELGISAELELAFRDHITYSPRIIKRLNALKVSSFFTTEKDFVKLPPEFLNQNRVAAIRWGMEISEKNILLDIMKAVLNKRYIE
jgi:tetraacyldisaccharide 4'-kinase